MDTYLTVDKTLLFRQGQRDGYCTVPQTARLRPPGAIEPIAGYTATRHCNLAETLPCFATILRWQIRIIRTFFGLLPFPTAGCQNGALTLKFPAGLPALFVC